MIKFTRYTTSLHPQLFVEHGDLFDLSNDFDGIAAFVPCGLTAFRCECDRFIEKDPPGIVMVADLNPHHHIYRDDDVMGMVHQAVDTLVRHGATRIGLNGIRTDGFSEHAIIDACVRWLRKYGERFPHVTLTLVDLRNSFRSWAEDQL